jgi:predicted Zn-dependent peptidase
MYHLTRLPNGLTIATAEMPHMASISLGLWVAIGGRYEPAHLNGVSHFLEHLLFKGTRKRSAREISQAVEGIGGYLNAFTSEESTCIFSKARHERADELLDVLTDMFLNSKFESGDIAKERDVIKDELAMYFDLPQHYVQELLNQTLWPDHPLGRPLTGTAKSLDAITRAHLLDYHRANYVAANTLLAAAGNLQRQQFVKAAAKAARHFTPGRRSQFLPANWAQKSPAVRLFTKATEQTQLALGIRTCSRHDERRFALRLLDTVLGENMSSRLFQVIREDHGLAYSISSVLSFFDDTGDLVISAGLETGNLRQTLKLSVEELRRLTRELVPAAEFRRARDYVIGQIDLSLENTESQMAWMGEQILGYGKVFPPEKIKQRVAEVKRSELRAAAREFFCPERLNLALVSPLKRDPALGKLLRW